MKNLVLILDDEPIKDHVFGTLKLEIEEGVWVPLERRCRLCNKLPIELLTFDWKTTPCEGLTSEPAL